MLRGVFVLTVTVVAVAVFGVTAALALGAQQTTDVLQAVVGQFGHYKLLRVDINRGLAQRTETPFEDPTEVRLAQEREILFALRHMPGSGTEQLEMAGFDQVHAHVLYTVPLANEYRLFEVMPQFSPSGGELAYINGHDGGIYVYTFATEQTHQVGTVVLGGNSSVPPIGRLGWSPDGAYLIAQRTATEIDFIPLEGGSAITLTVALTAGMPYMAWSPDNRRILLGPRPLTAPTTIQLVDLRAGTVEPLPGGVIGHQPVWDCTGSTLLYFDGVDDYRVKRLNLETGETTSPQDLPSLDGIFLKSARYGPACETLIVAKQRTVALPSLATLYAVDYDFTQARLLFEDVIYRGWTENGAALLFEQDGELRRYDVATGTLTPLASAPLPASHLVYLSPEQAYALYVPEGISRMQGLRRFDLATGGNTLLTANDEYIYDYHIDTQ